MDRHVGMFFGRIYQKRGLIFQPSWRSFAVYAGIAVLVLAAIEFNVLNILPANQMGNVLVAVPVFYFVLSVAFFVNDLIILTWRWYRARRKPPAGKRRRAASAGAKRKTVRSESVRASKGDAD